MPREKTGRNGIMNDPTKMIIKFRQLEKENAEKAKRTEKRKVSINPDTYIAKEILYQTAILKSIQHEVITIRQLLDKK